LPEIIIKLKYAMNSFRYDEGNVYEKRKSDLAANFKCIDYHFSSIKITNKTWGGFNLEYWKLKNRKLENIFVSKIGKTGICQIFNSFPEINLKNGYLENVVGNQPVHRCICLHYKPVLRCLCLHYKTDFLLGTKLGRKIT